MKRLAVIAAIAASFALGVGFANINLNSDMPCHWEDEVLVGTGDFVQDFGWTGMKCIPADDL